MKYSKLCIILLFLLVVFISGCNNQPQENSAVDNGEQNPETPVAPLKEGVAPLSDRSPSQGVPSSFFDIYFYGNGQKSDVLDLSQSSNLNLVIESKDKPLVAPIR